MHKVANVLNKMPKSMAPAVKSDLRDIWQAETRAAAKAAMDAFGEEYGAKYGKAVACLTKDREALLAFYDFPAEHCDHLRTANPIESVFATVRHRTVRTKGALSQKTVKLMVFTLVRAATVEALPENHSRCLAPSQNYNKPSGRISDTRKMGVEDPSKPSCRSSAKKVKWTSKGSKAYFREDHFPGGRPVLDAHDREVIA